MPATTWIRPHITAIEPYAPPDLEAIAARAGVEVPQLLRLDANENPFGPLPEVQETLADCDCYGYYPDYRSLKTAIAVYTGTFPEQVVLGNGADELIDLIIRLVLDPGQALAICPPAFGMYRFFAEVGRLPVQEVPRKDNFEVDAAAIETLTRQPDPIQPRLLFLTSPGNPDGQMIPADVVERLLALPLIVVVDEAYIEFGRPTVQPLLEHYENLVIIRTFSKWAGLAGLRLGYALLDPELTGYMERIRPPYNINTAAVLAALATLENLETVQANVGRLVAEREVLQASLAEIPWLEPLPSQANFILCHVHGCSGASLAGILADRGILIRSFSDPRLADYVRISVGRSEQNQVLLQALWELRWRESG